jgi:hypothetical protein
MQTIKIHNAETGQVIEREMNAEELEQLEADKLVAQNEAIAKLEAEAQAEAKRFAALAKLESLGLNEADLKALGL